MTSRSADAASGTARELELRNYLKELTVFELVAREEGFCVKYNRERDYRNLARVTRRKIPRVNVWGEQHFRIKLDANS